MYAPSEEPSTMVQYSVTSDWRTKIRETIKTLKTSFPEFRELIYATNQSIGPDADDLVTEARKAQGIWVDIRDRSWFVDRELTAPQREVASTELVARFVEPMLVERGVREHVGAPLTNDESKIALLHLALEASDEATEKGLTKRCFESLTLAALHDTSADRTIGRDAIVDRVKAALPAGYEQQISGLVEGCLGRLSRRGGPVKHVRADDAYHLSFAEQETLQARTTGFLLGESALESQLLAALRRVTSTELSEDDGQVAASIMRVGTETLLLRRGEAFAAASATGEVMPFETASVVEALKDSNAAGAPVTVNELAAAVVVVLEDPLPEVRAHLRKLADAYTLFAFLRQTPDVQKTVVKMFSGGSIWLDTSVVLPLIAETLIDDPSRRQLTVICRAALEAGVKLYVTDGVVEEVERHLNRSYVCSNMPLARWRGGPPFVFAAFLVAGRNRAEFGSWLEEFRGSARPEDDIRDYLSARFGISRRNLLSEADSAPLALRAIVQEIWSESHDRRRARGESDLDPGTISRLVAHDVENTVGVMQLRQQEAESPFGYREWLLTLDRTAFTLHRKLQEGLGRLAPRAPALSPEFLVQLLRIGPMRMAVERELRIDLPLLADFSRLDFAPRELIEAADRARQDAAGASEHVLRRRVRDSLDELRAKFGPQAFDAAVKAREQVLERLGEQLTLDVELGHDDR
jgi:hypothetical protein